MSIDPSWDGISVQEALARVASLRTKSSCALWIGDEVVELHRGRAWGARVRELAAHAGYRSLVDAIDLRSAQGTTSLQRGEDPEIELLAQALERHPSLPIALDSLPVVEGGVSVFDGRYRAVLTDTAVGLDWEPGQGGEPSPAVLAPDASASSWPSSRARVFPFCGDDARRWVLSMQRFSELLRAHGEYHRWLRSLLGAGPLVFVGVSPRTLVSLLLALELSPDESGRAGIVAFVDRSRVGSQADLDVLRWKFSVQCVLHDAAELRTIERDLCGASGALEAAAPRSIETVAPVVGAVTLENVGVHRSLTVPISSSWTVLLGENGTGKSSILRAVALALLGESEGASRAAASLLRAGSNTGSIQLDFEGDSTVSCVTTLARESNGVRPTARLRTPLEEQRLLVLGFPAVRGVSRRAMVGPHAIESGPPSPADVLPLVLGDVDPRLDDVRQWVINRWAKAQTERAGSQRERVPELYAFFETLSRLTPGAPWSFDHIDSARWDVLVRTDDGVVPLERLSQGIVSIVGWIGTLLYRLFDAFPTSSNPASERALVLIDELDAHLHPEWQRRIVPLMKEHFPKLQVIAATHSPLVVSSLRRDEVKVLERCEGAVAIRELTEDPSLLRVDQILTSEAFGLETTLSERARAMRDEHAALMAKSNKSRDELARLDAIEREWPASFDSASERQQATALFDRIAKKLHASEGGSDERGTR